MTKTTHVLCISVLFVLLAMLNVGVGVTVLAQDHGSSSIEVTGSISVGDTPGSASRSDSAIRIVPQDRVLSKREAADVVRQKLLQHIEIDLPGISMAAFASSLAETLDCPVHLDIQELELEGIDPETTIFSGSFTGVQLDVALRNLLPRYECGYYIDGGLLVITSRNKADTQLYNCVYDCQDLLGAEAEFFRATRLQQSDTRDRDAEGDRSVESTDGFVSTANPNTAQMGVEVRPIYAEDTLIEVITSTTGTSGNNGWLDEGTGAGTLSFVAGNLVVSQTEEVHKEIEELLHLLREALARRQPK